MRNGFDFIFLDRIYRIDGIFFACGERPFGQWPLDSDDPVDPVQLLFKNKNLFLFFSVLRYSLFKNFAWPKILIRLGRRRC